MGRFSAALTKKDELCPEIDDAKEGKVDGDAIEECAGHTGRADIPGSNIVYLRTRFD